MENQDDAQETKRCSNCKRDIPASNFVMHQSHCQRKIGMCPKCDEPVPRSEMENHDEEFHSEVKCGKCGKVMEKMQLEIHEEDECSQRVTTCCYCRLELAQSAMDEHQVFCSTRTEKCAACNRFIMVKDLDQHTLSGCQYPPPSPAKSRPVMTHRADGGDADWGWDWGRDPQQLLAGQQLNNRQPAGLAAAATSPPSNNNSRLNITRNLGGLPSRAALCAPERARPKLNNGRLDRGEGGQNGGSGTETDQLLAMHLAKDLTGDPGQGHRVKGGTAAALSPDLFLPCEFCHELLPADVLCLHQGTCQNEDLWEPTNSNNLLSNNNGGAKEASKDTWPSGGEGGAVEEFSLPCEFCHDLIPIEYLVQHQAMCGGSVAPTPVPVDPTYDDDSLDHRMGAGNQRSHLAKVTPSMIPAAPRARRTAAAAPFRPSKPSATPVGLSKRSQGLAASRGGGASGPWSLGTAPPPGNGQSLEDLLADSSVDTDHILAQMPRAAAPKHSAGKNVEKNGVSSRNSRVRDRTLHWPPPGDPVAGQPHGAGAGSRLTSRGTPAHARRPLQATSPSTRAVPGPMSSSQSPAQRKPVAAKTLQPSTKDKKQNPKKP